MRRKLRPWEKDAVDEIANAIVIIDTLVFPERPIPEILAVKALHLLPERGKVGYVSKESAQACGNLEHYAICAYRSHRFLKHGVKARIILASQAGKDYQGLPRQTLEEFLLGLAAHEVRHRVQCLRRLTLFSAQFPAEGCFVKYYIRFVEKYLEQVSPAPGHYETELDARVVGLWVKEEFHLWREAGQPGGVATMRKRIKEIILSGT
jgi:hypothetical protein